MISVKWTGEAGSSSQVKPDCALLRPIRRWVARELASFCLAFGRASPSCREQFHGTTIVSVRRKDADGKWQVAIGGDGQVTQGNIVVKGTARKVRKLYHDKALAG